MSAVPREDNDPTFFRTSVGSGTVLNFVDSDIEVKFGDTAVRPDSTYRVIPKTFVRTLASNPAMTARDPVESETKSEPTESPFESIYLEEHEELQKEIQRIRGLKQDYAETLATRLEQLVQLGYEDDPERIPLHSASLHNLFTLLQAEHGLSRPTVVLTPSRNIQAQWGKQHDRKLVAEFWPSGEVSYVVFSRNPRNPNKISRGSALVSTDSFLDTVRPFGALEWACGGNGGQ